VLQTLLSLIFGIAMLSRVFAVARRRASQSASARRIVITCNAVAVSLGLLLAICLPSRIPATDGSPASLVATVLLWILGGGLSILGLVAMLGGMLGRPDREAAGEGVKP
jgi:hypothetical protein